MVNPVSSAGSSYPVAAVTPENPVRNILPETIMGISLPPGTPIMRGQISPLRVDAAALEVFQRARQAGVSPDKTSPYGGELGAVRATAPAEPLTEAAAVDWMPGEAAFEGGGGMTSWLRERVSDIRDAARRERDLVRASGAEVRLAFDPNAGAEIPLSAGDPRFDQVKGARAMLDAAPSQLRLFGQNLTDFADLLSL